MYPPVESDGDNPSVRWACSGDGPASHVECHFATCSLRAAADHFERTGHAVDEVPS